MNTITDLIHISGAAGADEAGRGALAGPVVCAAVILPDGFSTKGLDDSKKLTRQQRETQEKRIKESANWAVVFVSWEEIDEINILQASLRGMERAFAQLTEPCTKLLVDGNQKPVVNSVCVEAHIKGDGSFAAIAAASILAKTARDRWMCEQELSYPGYGFDRHYGYAVPEHMEAIKRVGPCPIHRKTFEPIRSYLLQPCLSLDLI